MHPLDTLFYPRSIAILGASTNPSRTGYEWFHTLYKAGYKGKIFPVNPKGGELFGYPFYKSYEDIKQPVDLVINLLSAANTAQSMETIGRCGAKNVVIFTSGFAEMGGTGKTLQDEMLAIAKQYNVRVVGPNCMGIANLDYGLNCTSLGFYPKGPIGLISQSGNVGITVAYDAAKYDIGFSKLIFFGNQSDLSIHEFLEYFGQDENTKVIAMYVEGIKSGLGKEFLDAAKKVSKIKPIVLIKGGKTPNAVRAAISHTASLAGEASIFTEALKQAGVLEVDNLEELIPIAETLYRCPLCDGENISLVGSGGGHSILLTDAIEKHGFAVPPLTSTTIEAVKQFLPDYAPVANPIDMTGEYLTNLRLFADLTEITLQDPIGFSGAVNYSGYDLMVEDNEAYRDANNLSFAEGLSLVGDIQQKYGKPIVCYSPNACEKNINLTAQRNSGIPTYASFDLAATCLKALRLRHEALQKLSKEDCVEEPAAKKRLEDFIELAKARGHHNLTESEVLHLLASHEVPVPKWHVAFSEDTLEKMASEIGYPLVMKVVSPNIIHKSDVGGVVVNIKDENELLFAYRTMIESLKKNQRDADVQGVLLTPFIGGGIEIICGLLHDATFGPVMMIGAGGVLTEVLDDTAFLILPANRQEIHAALQSLKIYKVLEGVRGKRPVNINALVDLLYEIGHLTVTYPEIREADFNPIIVNEQAATIADARMVVE